jgi:Uri superfamily endonuclease
VKGTYLLILRLERDIVGLPVGKLGALDFPAGYYLYVGSAFGPGGMPARLAYHVRREKARPHWHIDYLRTQGHLEEAWCVACSERLERLWVDALSAERVVQTIAPGFGASDSPCKSHLFFSPIRPQPRLLTDTLLRCVERAPVCVKRLNIEIHTFDNA